MAREEELLARIRMLERHRDRWREIAQELSLRATVHRACHEIALKEWRHAREMINALQRHWTQH